MATKHDAPEPMDESLVQGGPSHRLATRLGMADSSARRRLLKVLLVLMLTWVPLALLSLVSGHAVGHSVDVTFFRDPEVHARFLFVVPLLELAEVMVAVSLAVQTKHLVEMGIVPEKDRGRFREAHAQAVRLRDAPLGEGAVAVLSITMSLVSRLLLGFNAGDSSWEHAVSVMTPAGWWYMLVSLPVLYFFLLRWVWVFLVWSWFLFQVSRLDLELTATHPDRTGGLGFIGWGLASFASVLMAVSAVMSAAFADEILNRGATLDDLKYHVIAFVVTALLVLHLPLLAFSGKLTRCRFNGLLEFGALAWRHDRAFDEKWIENRGGESRESILGSADVQSLADIATCYEHVDRMWPIPFDTKAFAVLVLAALVPMLPLLGTAIPLSEIFMKLGELLV
ncbi:MAG TPA: hypothetical protein VL475_03525 [Planctomycetaceae bacterium]|nr:hypothetical protein [Planctomycetaceae bacterium]